MTTMARQRFAPTFSLVGTPRYVPAGDSAWRQNLLPDADDEKNPAWREHPFWQYLLGNTRFDLEDSALAEFIDLDARPETWTLKPLKLKDRSHVRFLLRRDLQEDANAYAFARCVVSAENLEGEPGKALAELLAAKKRDHEAIVDAAHAYAVNVIDDVGNAIITLSGDLAPREKKASDSPPGGGSPSPGT